MKRNAVARQVAGYEEAKQAGDFYFVYVDGDVEAAGMVHTCPCGCGQFGSLWFKGKRSGGAEWQVSGQWPKVTLTPSIGFWGQNSDAQGFHWHGYLRDGVFEEC